MGADKSMQKALKAWGQDMPEWVRILANDCDKKSLRSTAQKIGVSPALISLAINKKRKKLTFIQGKVEKFLMLTQASCPVLGVINKEDCLQHQRAPFSSANPMRIHLYAACRNGCTFYQKTKV